MKMPCSMWVGGGRCETGIKSGWRPLDCLDPTTVRGFDVGSGGVVMIIMIRIVMRMAIMMTCLIMKQDSQVIHTDDANRERCQIYFHVMPHSTDLDPSLLKQFLVNQTHCKGPLSPSSSHSSLFCRKIYPDKPGKNMTNQLANSWEQETCEKMIELWKLIDSDQKYQSRKERS